ncbi:hypothetical protein [Blastococcus brunescens]|uniref:Uncharacterized protein n=1 Tax=Blastococcus brunescens TaxID=1564165 RepID=A0ABZ1AY29_9ACTN|nr:hypothetical protein [Blastococcus sp. BMG 8361]WRL63476.1 hypothetical protein U6N30_27795 [Blastococcus sp. BMG 8361]
METLAVAGRFCGPPGTANGGYLAGRLAPLVDSPAVSVRLRRPIPLDPSPHLLGTITVRQDSPSGWTPTM